MFTSTGCRNADKKDTAPLNKLYETNMALSIPCTLSMHVFAISHRGCGWRVCVPIPIGQKLEHPGPLQLPLHSTSTLYLNANLKKQCFMTFLKHYNYLLDSHIHKYKYKIRQGALPKHYIVIDKLPTDGLL